MIFTEENWNYEVEIVDSFETECFTKFKVQMNNFDECVLKIIENSFRPEYFKNNNSVKHNSDDDLINLVENNKTLRQEIDLKIKEIQKQQNQYETLKKDLRVLSQEVKEKHEAYLMAKKYYKKFLKIYFTIEWKNDDGQTIFLQFFTDAKKDSENYSIRLLRNFKNGRYELLSSTPKLHNFKEIQNKFQNTNDVQGALCCIKQSFEKIKNQKRNKYEK